MWNGSSDQWASRTRASCWSFNWRWETPFGFIYKDELVRRCISARSNWKGDKKQIFDMKHTKIPSKIPFHIITIKSKLFKVVKNFKWFMLTIGHKFEYFCARCICLLPFIENLPQFIFQERLLRSCQT